ncbi:MAG: septum formation initiator family protein [Treponema sp.]|nr:septum formation initiator family protein [Treponema sp.]
MRILKYLIAVWVAIAIYTIFSFLGGPRSISAYNYLLSERDHQWENIKTLGILNEELEKTKNNLIYDQETILIHARLMGYGQENERFIRIVGLGNINPIPSKVGNVYTAQKPDYIPDKHIKIAAFCIGLLVFAFLFMLEFIETRSK